VSGVLIADEPGLGKTVQALAAVEAIGAYPCVVVVPASVRVNWQREIAQWLPHRTVEIARTNKAHEISADYVVVGWDTLRAWVNHLPAVSVILDEIHLAKNGKSQRAHAAFALAERTHDSGGFVIGLTGTPVPNRADEIKAQLRLIGRLNEFGGSNGFDVRYGAGRNGILLNREMRARCYVRRRKSDVLADLPEKEWIPIILEGDPEIMKEYAKLDKDFKETVQRDFLNARSSSDIEMVNERLGRGGVGLGPTKLKQLALLDKLKQVAVRAKQDGIKKWIADNFEGTGKKLVIFAWHRDVVDWIADEYANGCKIQGGMTDTAKQAAIDKFQNDPDQQFISCSIKAAGVGITLTAASDVLFIEQGWNPADQDQAADRCHRLGQRDSVSAYTAICLDTIDEKIFRLIEKKRVVVNAVTQGGVTMVDDEIGEVDAGVLDGVIAETLQSVGS
jgi:SNF2 family DNA or RNA helicase